MDKLTTPDAYGELIEPATLKIQRLLPGPVERIWAWLTDSELRRQWLASGDMQPEVGTPFTLTWRNDELTDPPGQRPAGFSEEHSMDSKITVFDPPRKLAFTWGESGEVSFELDQRGKQVLLTVIHRRLPDRNMTLMVGAGWHMHLDILVARVTGAKPAPFWDGWTRLKTEYDQRVLA
ncbi:MAG: SRPBCC family protein [Burkholderiales bacterium]|jgi:uncharacterized protein YndB with AHSA1/START domain